MSRQEERREGTRKKMLNAASREFRSHGFSGIGVDGIAKEAGVTSGAFYAHLGSKGKAFYAALEFSLEKVIEDILGFQEDYAENWLAAFVDFYLGLEHRDDLACGCALTTLSPEVVRLDEKTKALYDERMTDIVNVIAHGLSGGTSEDRIDRSRALIGILVGGLTMARAVGNKEAADSVAASIRRYAMEIAG